MADSPNIPVIDCCKTCRFWQFAMNARSGTLGHCRRNPPVILDKLVARLDFSATDIAPATAYPVVQEDDWCGEFQKPRLDCIQEPQVPGFHPPEIWNDPKVTLPGIGVKVRWLIDAAGRVYRTGYLHREGKIANDSHPNFWLSLEKVKGWLPLLPGED